MERSRTDTIDSSAPVTTSEEPPSDSRTSPPRPSFMLRFIAPLLVVLLALSFTAQQFSTQVVEPRSGPHLVRIVGSWPVMLSLGYGLFVLLGTGLPLEKRRSLREFLRAPLRSAQANRDVERDLFSWTWLQGRVELHRRWVADLYGRLYWAYCLIVVGKTFRFALGSLALLLGGDSPEA